MCSARIRQVRSTVGILALIFIVYELVRRWLQPEPFIISGDLAEYNAELVPTRVEPDKDDDLEPLMDITDDEVMGYMQVRRHRRNSVMVPYAWCPEHVKVGRRNKAKCKAITFGEVGMLSGYACAHEDCCVEW